MGIGAGGGWVSSFVVNMESEEPPSGFVDSSIEAEAASISTSLTSGAVEGAAAS